MPNNLKNLALAPVMCLLCAGFLQAVHAQDAKPKTADVATNMGELMRLDADAATAAEKRKAAGQSGDVIPMANDVMRSEKLSAKFKKADPAPFALSRVIGMTGARRIQMQLDDGQVLNFIEGARLVDPKNPNWKLVSISGACATFETTKPILTQTSKGKKNQATSEMAKPQSTCYMTSRAIANANLSNANMPMPGLPIGMPSSYPNLISLPAQSPAPLR